MRYAMNAAPHSHISALVSLPTQAIQGYDPKALLIVEPLDQPCIPESRWIVG